MAELGRGALGRGALAAVCNGALLTLVAWLAETSSQAAVVVAGATLLAGVEASLQRRDDRVGHAPLALLSGVSLLALLVLAAARPGLAAAPWVGGGLMAVGIALRASAMRSLGEAFVTEVRPSATMVTGGIYRWLRHPSEAGLLMFGLGAAVATGSGGAFALLALMVALALLRIEREERGLRANFGAAFDAYAARVPALVPRLVGLR